MESKFIYRDIKGNIVNVNPNDYDEDGQCTVFKPKSMTFEEIQPKVIQWAKNKNLIFKDNSLRQYSKTMEEVKEVYDALLNNDQDALKDGIGDVIVTLIILAEQNGLVASECLESAWNEIKDRKGKTLNGTFIKDETKMPDYWPQPFDDKPLWKTDTGLKD